MKKKRVVVKPLSKTERVKTNIPGFDKLVQGGFVKGSVNLLSGGPGSGKTIFCLQFLYNGARDLNENGLFISFEENLAGLKNDAHAFGWNFEDLERKNKITFITFNPFGNPGLKNEIIKTIKKNNIKRVVIDSISVYTLAFVNDLFKVRKEFYNLCDMLEALDCTTVFTAEVDGEAAIDVTTGGKLSRSGMIEFVADSVITVHNAGIGGETDRAIRILKMRRTKHEKAPTPMKITDKGMYVLKG